MTAGMQTLAQWGKYAVGAGAEAGIAPPTWSPPSTFQFNSGLVSGIEAVQSYAALGKNVGASAASLASSIPGVGPIPKWATDLASTGGLWAPMKLEAEVLVATLESAANKAFTSISKDVKKLAQYAPLITAGVEVGKDILALAQATTPKAIASAAVNLVKNAVDVISSATKAAGLVTDAFACVPYLGMVASVLSAAIQMALEYLPSKSPEEVYAEIRKADEEAWRRLEQTCKSAAEQAVTLEPTGKVPGSNEFNVSPADLFRPISYWLQKSVDWYVSGKGSYKTVYGDKGMSYEPMYPAPPMTPVWFYVALCGDVLPPILRPTTCGVQDYERGWLAHRKWRQVGDCYTDGVDLFRRGNNPWQKTPNPKFGIPRATRKLMWTMIQSILGAVKSPMLSGFSQADDGLMFYSTLQQIVFNEYLSGRINEAFLEYLNLDLVQRNGMIPSDKGYAEVKGEKGQTYWGRATCRDHGVRIDTPFWKQIGQFQRHALKTEVAGKPVYDSVKEAFTFDASQMKKDRNGPANSMLIVEKNAEKNLEASLKGETKDRMAEGAIPWVTVIAAGGAGLGAWLYARNKARGGKR